MKKMFSVLMENGIVISVALGISYLLSYHYQKGKLDYYGIPVSYVDFSLPNIVAIFSIVLSMCYVAIIFMNPILHLAIGTKDYRMIKIWITLIGLAVLLGIETVLIQQLPIISCVLFALFLIYLLVQVVLTIVKIKEKCGFVQKWKKYSALQLDKDGQESTNTSAGTFSGANKKINHVFVVVATFFFLCTMFRFAGAQSAQSCTEYYIAKDYESKVVIHNNQDYYVLMERDGEALVRGYEIVPVSEIGNIYYEKTGKLTISKISK